jgi:hypothetical protein
MASTVTMSTVTIAKRNGHCQHCGHRFFSSAPNPAPICYHCESAGRTVETDAEPVEEPASAGAITYLGQLVNAPGFSQDQFTRAMLRAFRDDLQIASYHDGRQLVGCQGVYGYVVTRGGCDCKAGRAGTPCKHKALLVAHLDIRQPHVRREWAKLNRERPIRKAVAA